jgi:hypothetical protein
MFHHIPISGTLEGNTIRFHLKIGKQEQSYEGTTNTEAMSGSSTMTRKEGMPKGEWTARRTPRNTML